MAVTPVVLAKHLQHVTPMAVIPVALVQHLQHVAQMAVTPVALVQHLQCVELTNPKRGWERYLGRQFLKIF